MQLKPITAITVLSLVVASLFVSGCTSNNTSITNQTPSGTTTHDAFLENYLAAFKNDTHADKNETVKVWEVTWANSTSAQLEYTWQNKSTNATETSVSVYTVFPTTQAATNYLNSLNKTAYSFADTVNTTAIGYKKYTGHLPLIYKYYEWNEENPLNISEYKQHYIVQFDNLIKTGVAKRLTS